MPELIAQLLHVYTKVGSSFSPDSSPSCPYSDMSADAQILLLSEPAVFPGRERRDCIQVFSLLTVQAPEPHWLKPFTVPLSYLLISFRLNYSVLAALTLYFYCRGSYKVCCKTALSFLGKFSMCLLCKECDLYHCEKKKFSFIF